MHGPSCCGQSYARFGGSAPVVDHVEVVEDWWTR